MESSLSNGGLASFLFDASFGHGAAWQKQGEVVAAKITRNAAVLLRQAAQLFAERPQQIVALVPAVPFVEDLEMLDVHVHGLVGGIRRGSHLLFGPFVEGGCVVQIGEQVLFHQLLDVAIFGQTGKVGALDVVDVGDEAHDHRFPADAALHGHDGLGHPAPRTVGSLLAEFAAQAAAFVLDALQQRVEVPEVGEPLAVFRGDHAVQHFLEHAVKRPFEGRDHELVRLVVQDLVGIPAHVDLEQLVVGGRLAEGIEQVAPVVARRLRSEQGAGPVSRPVDPRTRDFEPPVEARAVDDALTGDLVAQVVERAVGARRVGVAHGRVAEGAEPSVREYAPRLLVDIDQAVLLVDRVNVSALRRRILRFGHR